MRVLVVTTVHHPEDSRIRARQVRAMLEAGWDVTYAASFAAHDVTPRAVRGLTVVDLPRARGRRRLSAFLAARHLIRSAAAQHDVVVLHDPELLLAAAGAGRRVPVVWDVHEDTAAAVVLKPWLPRPLRAPAAGAFRGVERIAERRTAGLLLAEAAYQDRFRHPHPVILNTVLVPESVSEPGDARVVYVGALSAARGAAELVAVGRLLRERTAGAATLHLVGGADAATRELLTTAHAAGDLEWHGYLPSTDALTLLDGALAGLSLLHDSPNYAVSIPTKVVEYMAFGVPVVTTPLPLARALVEEAGSGVVVPFEDAERTVEAVLALRDDPELRRRLGAAGHAHAAHRYDWAAHSDQFLEALTTASRRRGRG
ncbi:glycosyltransferase [Cellulomonas sp. URHD0024]|uniref:glycosyltransferase n=1 Tax=Cellulomonas sp. URHD0024 TaxID=1302620 RepID=UPI000422DB0E|nr:glycosyltransferase [Cellulomonas sp. URHD0024]